MTFVVFDTETTGLNRSFDQILQFAAIRLDDELNQIEEFEIRSRLLPDIVPSVSALRLNRVTAHQFIDPTLPSHYEMVRRIREKMLAWSPAVFVGFNSINFDEHLIRHALYRTLHPPYLTNTNNNSRLDAMRVVQASSVLAPGTIAVPSTATSDRSFRLDRVAPANDFEHEDAHDAKGDVRATIHLCRLLRTRAFDLWSTAIRLSRKPAILDFAATVPIYGLTEFYYGLPYSWIVTTIGYGEKNSNEIFVFNLGVAPEGLLDLDDYMLRKRLAQRPKPVRRIRANAVPILTTIEKSPRFAEGLSLGVQELQRRARLLRDRPDVQARLVAAFEANRKTREPSLHIEEQLYDAFFSDGDYRLMDAFHAAPWAERLSIVDRFADGRLREIGHRLLHCERPDLLDPAVRQAHDIRIARQLLGLDDQIPTYMTLKEAIREANDLLVTAHGEDLSHVREHRDFLQRRLAEAMRVIG